jgi:AraC-like DNA-binding protein
MRGEQGAQLGIARLAAVYIGHAPRIAHADVLAHRIIFDAATGPHALLAGANACAWKSVDARAIAFLDVRRFAVADVEALLRLWRRLGDIDHRLDDVLDDLDAVRARRLSARISQALGLLREGRTPSQTAKAIGVSETRLTRWFNADLGAPPKRWQVWMRMRRGLDCLMAGETATASSHEAGFSDAAHFTRQCRTMFGLPPGKIATLELRKSVSERACVV